jgi:hypothetical protein
VDESGRDAEKKQSLEGSIHTCNIYVGLSRSSLALFYTNMIYKHPFGLRTRYWTYRAKQQPDPIVIQFTPALSVSHLMLRASLDILN